VGRAGHEEAEGHAQSSVDFGLAVVLPMIPQPLLALGQKAMEHFEDRRRVVAHGLGDLPAALARRRMQDDEHSGA